MTKNFSYKLTIYSFVMSLIIVLFHTDYYANSIDFVFLNQFDYQLYLQSYHLFDIIGSLSLGYFFLASGFLMYNNASSENIWQKVRRHFFSLVIPFYSWNFIYMLYYIYNDRGITFGEPSVLIGKLTYSPFCFALWYMFTIMLIIFLAPLIVKLKNRPFSCGIVLGLLFILTVYVYVFNGFSFLDTTPFYEWIKRNILYLPFYFTGAFAALNYRDYFTNAQYNRNICTAAAIVLFALTTILACIYFDNDKIRWIVKIIQPFIVWFIVPDSLFAFRNDVHFAFRISFPVYALHTLLLWRIKLFFYKHIRDSYEWHGYHSPLLRILIVIGVYLFTLAMTAFLKRFFPKVLKLFTGSRL